ncbi:hypothetical protein TanjilG_31644 [Lupinus angustifolius]|uniref:Uncharacterized protein n=1 Tax=Lupinus angustifolius TaxID=3871 RepID=A0A394DEE5_LUPAN|nr:hypothetical protein TanjilG_31644 [Lupinus angustifolius]
MPSKAKIHRISAIHFRPVNNRVDVFSYNRDFEILVALHGDGPNPLVVSQTASATSRVSPRLVVPNDSPRVVPVSDNGMFVHLVSRRTGPCRIFTRVVKNGIRRGSDPIVVEAEHLIIEFWARREARSQRSGMTINDFSDSEDEDEDEEEMAIPNALWYSADVVVLVPEHVVTPLVEEHHAGEELISYPLVIIINSDTEMEEDPKEDPDEPESSDS